MTCRGVSGDPKLAATRWSAAAQKDRSRLRTTGRFYAGEDDASDDELDFDNFATRAPDADADPDADGDVDGDGDVEGEGHDTVDDEGQADGEGTTAGDDKDHE